MSDIKEVEDIKKEEILKPQEYISPTSINTYHRCPKKYFFNYIAKLKTKPSIDLIKGGICHKFLEDFFKYYKDGMENDHQKLFDKVVSSYESRIKDLELKPEEYTNMLLDCKNMIEEFLFSFKRKMKALVDSGKAENLHHAFYLLKPKFKELKVESEKLKCRGYIDSINEDYNGVLTLGDYKTSKKYGLNFDIDYKRQLAIYSLLYREQEKRQPDFAAINFLRYGETFFLEVTPSLLKQALDTITDVYAKTRSTDLRDYPKIENNLCRWCDYISECDGKEDWEKKARLQKMEIMAKPKETEVAKNEKEIPQV